MSSYFIFYSIILVCFLLHYSSELGYYSSKLSHLSTKAPNYTKLFTKVNKDLQVSRLVPPHSSKNLKHIFGNKKASKYLQKNHLSKLNRKYPSKHPYNIREQPNGNVQDSQYLQLVQNLVDVLSNKTYFKINGKMKRSNQTCINLVEKLLDIINNQHMILQEMHIITKRSQDFTNHLNNKYLRQAIGLAHDVKNSRFPIYFQSLDEVPPQSNTDDAYTSLQKRNEAIDSIRKSCLEFLSKTNEKLLEAYRSNTLAQWEFETNITQITQRNLDKSALNFSICMKKIWADSIEFKSHCDCELVNDTKLSRQFKILSSLGEAALSPQKYTELQQTVHDMETIYSTATICGYAQNVFEKCKCGLPMDPNITDIAAHSRDPAELKYIWLAWRDATGKKMKSTFIKYVALINDAAILNGYKDAADFWLSAYDDDCFEWKVKEMWDTVRPLYLQLHAYVRRKLVETYGPDIVSKDGIIPAHLLGNIWGQTWVNIYNISTPYPAFVLPDLTALLQKFGYTPRKMFEEAQDFFTSINFTALPNSFWRNSIFEAPSDNKTKVICHASAWDMYQDDDFRIKMCTQVTAEDFITIHHEMGHVQYYMQYKNLPTVFREGANPGFHEAIGDVIALSVCTPYHMKKLHLLGETQKEMEDEEAINFLYQMALQKIAFLPYAYVVDHWRWNVFRGLVEPKDFNKNWWQLRIKYQGIGPPIQRGSKDFDPGAKYHIAAGVPYLRYFVSFIIQFQFYEALCKRTQYNGPFHECDIYEEAEAGNLLKRMLKMGFSEPWQTAMYVLTGTREMNPQALLKYFRPLEMWLESENLRTGEKIGWDWEFDN